MQMTVWTTTECNMKCSYCYERKGNMGNNINKMMDEKNIINYLITHLTDNNLILFHGGEPLLNFAFIKKATKEVTAVDKNCKFGLTTNGTIWSDEIEEFFCENANRFADWISISIDGTEEWHNQARKYKNGKYTYKDIIQTSKDLIKIFPDIRVRMTITPNNSKHLSENVECLINLGFIKIASAFDLYDDNWSDNDFLILSQEIDKLIIKYNQNSKIFIGVVEEWKSYRKKGYCTFSQNLYIDGNIYPCAYVVGDEKFKIGDIEKGIEKVRYEKLLHSVKQDNIECKGCTNLMYCTYNRCKFINYSVEGNNNIPCAVGCAYENLKFEKMKQYKSILSTKNRKGGVTSGNIKEK